MGEWGLAGANLPLYSIGGEQWFCIDGTGAGYRVDLATLTLTVDFSPEMFARRTESARGYPDVPVTYSNGSFLNYDLRSTYTTGTFANAANWEVGLFGRPGLLTSSFISSNDGRGTIRLDTQLRRDDPIAITSAIAGDVLTRPGPYGASVRIGGLQYARNFSNAPQLITYPGVNVEGTAVVPSTVDIFVNNARTHSAQVRPGPFSISNLPVPVGAGDVRLVVRDVFGQEQVVVTPFVRYETLLKPGLHDFSYEVGALRRNYTSLSDDYGPVAAVGTHRYGVTDRLTIAGHVEAMSDRGNVGGAVSATVPVMGLLTAAGAASTGIGTGWLAKLQFLRRERDWSAGGSVEKRSDKYIDIAYEPDQIRTLSVRQLTASARVTQNQWLSFLVLDNLDTSGRLKTSSLTWTVSLPHSINLSANLTRINGSLTAADTVFALALSMPFGSRDYAALTAEKRQSAREPDVLFTATRNLLETQSFGYRVVAGQQNESQRLEAGAYAQTGVGQFGIETSRVLESTTTRAYARGGIAAAGGEWSLSRYLDASFAMVKVGDFPNVEVTANSQPIGRTDKDGLVVIPRLTGFLTNRIAFDPEHISLEGNFEKPDTLVKIANRMGVVVDMGVKREISATLTLLRTDGSPMLAGATVRLEGLEAEFPVASGGRTFVSGLQRGKMNHADVEAGDLRCRASFDVPAQFESGRNLGPFTCK